jgi:hypothetical protein
MNTQLLNDKALREKITEEWAIRKGHAKHYPTPVMWWSRLVKRTVKMVFVTEGADRRKDRRATEAFYYSAIRSLVYKGVMSNENVTKLNALKAKIVCLKRVDMQKQTLDVGEVKTYPGEKPTLFHLIRAGTRQEQRHITTITDAQGNRHTTNQAILKTFTHFLQKKYGEKLVDMREVDAMGNIIPNKVTQDENDDMIKEVTMVELEEAVRSGKNIKSPGNDGICQEFYKVNWATIKSELLEVIRWMHSKGDITQQQKHGIIVYTEVPAPGVFRGLPHPNIVKYGSKTTGLHLSEATGAGFAAHIACWTTLWSKGQIDTRGCRNDT